MTAARIPPPRTASAVRIHNKSSTTAALYPNTFGIGSPGVPKDARGAAGKLLLQCGSPTRVGRAVRPPVRPRFATNGVGRVRLLTHAECYGKSATALRRSCRYRACRDEQDDCRQRGDDCKRRDSSEIELQFSLPRYGVGPNLIRMSVGVYSNSPRVAMESKSDSRALKFGTKQAVIGWRVPYTMRRKIPRGRESFHS
jgi:hypothetical protein